MNFSAILDMSKIYDFSLVDLWNEPQTLYHLYSK